MCACVCACAGREVIGTGFMKKEEELEEGPPKLRSVYSGKLFRSDIANQAHIHSPALSANYRPVNWVSRIDRC